MKRDILFQEEVSGPFSFNQKVSSVFDDMATRSIPWYTENIRMCGEIISSLCHRGNLIVDLGCSTGNALSHIIEEKGPDFYRLVGVDYSAEMLAQAKKNFQEKKLTSDTVSWVCLDISHPQHLQSFEQCQCFLLRYTLQFLRIEARKNLLISLRNLCAPGGFLLLSEKVRNPEDSPLLLDDWYHQYKHRNGYSWIEIQRKNLALREVLVPLTVEENVRLIKNAGFARVETIFHWYNFVTFFVSIS